MKKIVVLAVIALVMAACHSKPNTKETKELSMSNKQKAVVVYFSATGTTKQVAQNLAQAAHADIYEIKPVTAYTSADLNWRDSNSRSSVEMHDKNTRPAIVADDFSVKDYDTVFLGFPIWWGTAPSGIYIFGATGFCQQKNHCFCHVGQ